jgi:hypothetical protein
MKDMLDVSENKDQCVYFDFNRCSLKELSKDYSKLFELQYEKIMYVRYSLY